MSSLKDSFLNYCKKNNYEENTYQLQILDLVINFLSPKKSFFKFFFESKKKIVFIYMVA